MKKRASVVAGLGLMLILAGCADKGDKKVEKEDVTVIGGKDYTTQEVENLSLDDGYDFGVGDILLVEILDTYYGDIEGLEENYEEYLGAMVESGVEFTEEEKKQLKSQIKYSTQLQKAYDELIVLDDKAVKEAFEEGFPVIDVEHAVLNPEKLGEDDDGSAIKEVQERLDAVSNNEEYDKLRDEFEAEELAHMLPSTMSKTTVIPGFEDILETEEGKTVTFGEGTFQSVMKVVSKRTASEDEVRESLRNKEIMDNYGQLEDLILAFEDKYEDLKISKEVKDLLTGKTEEEPVEE